MNIAFIGFRHSHIYGLYREAQKNPHVRIAKSFERDEDAKRAAEKSAQFMTVMDNGVGLIADVSYSAPGFLKTLPTYWDFYFWGMDCMINYNFASKNVYVYKNGKSEPETIKSCPLETGPLDEFIKAIRGESSLNDTETVLNSSEDTLKIQTFADENTD